MGYVEPAAFVYRQAVELGLNVPRYGFTSGSEEQFLKVVTSAQMEGVWDLRPTELTIEALGPQAKAYDANYRKKFNQSPTPSSPYAYDQVYVLKNAIERAGSAKDAKKVAEAVRTLPIPKEAVMKYMANDGSAMFDQNGQGGADRQWMTVTMYIYELGWGSQKSFGRAASVSWILFLIIIPIHLYCL